MRLAGHTPPPRGAASDHAGPGLLRILDRLADTPAEIITESGETLRQTPLGAALLGDASLRTGPERNLGYRGPSSHAAWLVDLLLDNDEFRALWQTQEVGVRPPQIKRFLHPSVGRLELSCQTLIDPDQSHRLLVYTATPGSESYERLQLLAVVGAELLAP